MNVVYHGSSRSGLKQIKPHRSTHGEEWVYATRNLAISVLFLANYGGDFTCCIGRESINDKPYVCERFPGAFSLRYKDKKGSVYRLDGTDFLANRTTWDEELVSAETVEVLEEILIEDVMGYLLELHRSGEMTVMKYPQRPPLIPDDDEDLVERGIVWTRQFGEKILKDIRKFHPHLLDRVKDGLKSGKYLLPKKIES